MNVGTPAKRGRSKPDTGWKNGSLMLLLPVQKQDKKRLRRTHPNDYFGLCDARPVASTIPLDAALVHRGYASDGPPVLRTVSASFGQQ